VVETDDFRHVMEEVSGLELEWFFEQWCRRPGTPSLKVAATYDPSAGEVQVDVEQTQQIDDRTPAFRFELPVLLQTSTGGAVHTIPVRERRATGRFPINAPPTMIVIDPHLHVLKSMELDVPLGLLLTQAESGPTIAARRAAIAALATHDRPEVRLSLERIGRDEGRRYTERAQAIEVLGGFASAEARERVVAIFDDGIEEARVRKAVVAALARQLDGSKTPGPALQPHVKRLVGVATSDRSADCRVVAIRRLGGLQSAGLAAADGDGASEGTSDELGDVLYSLLSTASHGEKVRLAALEAMAQRNDARALEPAIESSRFGVPDRARPDAIAVIGRLGSHDRKRALEALLPLLDDRERRSVLAAGSALVELRAVEARPRIAALAESGPSGIREQAQDWLKRIDQKP